MIEFLKEVSNTVQGLLGPDFLISFLIRSSVILLFAFILQRVLHRYSSSAKYRILNISLIAILLIPIVPEFEKPIEIDLYAYEAVSVSDSMIDQLAITNDPSIQIQPTLIETSDLSVVRLSLLDAMVLIWITGCLLLLTLLLREAVWLWILLYTGTPLKTLHALEQSKDWLKVKRNVHIYVNNRVNTPLTFGSLIPFIVLPGDAKEWEFEKLRIVLLHELTHIKRNDYLSNLLSSLGVIVNWYNPFAWLALQFQKVECEKACDENVLACEISPSLYATALLNLAEQDKISMKLRMNSMVSILGTSGVKERIKLILTNPVRKKAISWSATLMLTVFILFEAVALSSMQFYKKSNDAVSNLMSPEIKNPLTSINSSDLQERRDATQMLITNFDRDIIPALLNRLDIESDPYVKSKLIAALAKFEDSREFYRIAKHINSEDVEVRLQVMNYMRVISCFPSYLVVEANVHHPDPAIAQAAHTLLNNFDNKKLKESITNFAVNFKYNNKLSIGIGQKMSWINGYPTVDRLAEILMSEDAIRKRQLGEDLLAVVPYEKFEELKNVIHTN